jgi:hypothetical protein
VTNLKAATVGPGSSTDNVIVRWNGTTRHVIQNSTVLLSDTNRFTVSGQTLLYADPGQSNFLAGMTTLGTMTGFNNTFIDVNAGGSMSSTAGSNNTGYSYGTIANLGAGNGNIAIGTGAGSSYDGTESTNICIGLSRVPSDNNVIAIGGLYTSCFMRGVYGITLSGTNETMTVNSLGQIGSAEFRPQHLNILL